MRAIKQTGQFRRDLKREAKGPHRATLTKDFVDIIKALAKDEPLAEKYHDHPLGGDWGAYRDCYIKPDLVLIYRKPDTEWLELVRLGSHSELGL